MEKPTSILVVASGKASDSVLVAKATRMARQFGARLELFLCDSEHAYALERAYVPSGVEEARQACVARAMQYLTHLKDQSGAAEGRISVDATCESPLYEGIVRKVLRSRPDLVIKGAGGGDPATTRTAFDANDWQLMRTCPVTLMLVGGKTWNTRPQFAAAVDISEQETEGLARVILGSARCFAQASGADLEVLYAERASTGGAGIRTRAIELRNLARQSQVNTDHVHILAGNPELILPAFTRTRDYDVLVLGALTHREGSTSLVGTLTSKLVEALACDFVLVKPSSYQCPVEVADEGDAGRHAQNQASAGPARV